MLDGAYDRFADLGRAIGVADDKTDDKTAAESFAEAVRGICAYCEVPTPAGYGINKEEFFAQINKMASDAITSGSPGNTRKAVGEEECIRIYKKLWD